MKALILICALFLCACTDEKQSAEHTQTLQSSARCFAAYGQEISCPSHIAFAPGNQCFLVSQHTIDASAARPFESGSGLKPRYTGYGWDLTNTTAALRYPYQAVSQDRIYGWRIKWYTANNALLRAVFQRSWWDFTSDGAIVENLGDTQNLPPDYSGERPTDWMEFTGINEFVDARHSYSIVAWSSGQPSNYVYNAEVLVDREIKCPEPEI